MKCYVSRENRFKNAPILRLDGIEFIVSILYSGKCFISVIKTSRADKLCHLEKAPLSQSGIVVK